MDVLLPTTRVPLAKGVERLLDAPAAAPLYSLLVISLVREGGKGSP